MPSVLRGGASNAGAGTGPNNISTSINNAGAESLVDEMSISMFSSVRQKSLKAMISLHIIADEWLDGQNNIIPKTTLTHEEHI